MMEPRTAALSLIEELHELSREADGESQSLQAMLSHIVRSFTRVLHLTPGVERFADKGGAVAAAPVGEDSPDEIDSPVYDLGTPLREELLLAIDPYPRAPGVAFEPPADEDHPESPFAVLKKPASSPRAW